MFFLAKDGEAIYRVSYIDYISLQKKKKELELAVAQIMNLLQNSGLN